MSVSVPVPLSSSPSPSSLNLVEQIASILLEAVEPQQSVTVEVPTPGTVSVEVPIAVPVFDKSFW